MTGKRSKERKAGSGRRTAAALCLAALFAAAFATVFIHGGYPDKVLAKLGLRRNEVPVDWATGWCRCLEYSGVDADVVFFGDSITSGGDFSRFFPDISICNLGVPGDTLRGMAERGEMIAAVKPEKVFVMGGINSLTDSSYDRTLEEYRALLDRIGEVTDAEVCVQGILPVSAKQEKRLFVRNSTISRFNLEIAMLAEERGYTYIDLYGVFLKDGEMDPACTKEGIHLNAKGYRTWADAIAGEIRKGAR